MHLQVVGKADGMNAMQEQEYRRRENWHGACYEVAIDYTELLPGELSALMERLWTASTLRGPFAGPYALATNALDPAPPATAASESGSLEQYGLIEIQRQRFVGCKTRLSAGDWFYLCIPMGMLDLVYSISYPLTLENNLHWMREADMVLIDIAQHLYSAAPFNLAVVGEEAGAVYPRAKDITQSELDHGGCLISPSLFERMHLSSTWQVLPTGLRWRPWQG